MAHIFQFVRGDKVIVKQDADVSPKIRGKAGTVIKTAVFGGGYIVKMDEMAEPDEFLLDATDIEFNFNRNI